VNRLTSAARADTNIWNIFILQDDNVLNAAATRGNYVFVWTGLLDFIGNDAELAAVLGHEIGHVLAGHTKPTAQDEVNEILIGIAGVAADVAVGRRVGDLGSQLAQILAEAILVNPGRQSLELEADHIGLFMMSKAGYNPLDAIELWERLSNTSSSVSESTFALLSSHPPSQERINQLEKLMPRALDDYEDAKRNPTRIKPKQTFARDRLKNELALDNNKIVKLDNHEVWLVKTDWTEVYTQPDQNSRLKTRLYYDAKVLVTEINGTWLKISKPVSGFVQESDLIRE
jgi:predicted Zn-dependent protease